MGSLKELEDPSSTIFSRQRINALTRDELITALLENDEDYVQASLITKTNAQLRRELLDQSDLLFEEVRERDDALNAQKIDESQCNPTLSGDCAEPFRFFQNELAQDGETREISATEIELGDLRADLGGARQFQAQRDRSFRGLVSAMMKASVEEVPEEWKESVVVKMDTAWPEYYAALVDGKVSPLHEQVYRGEKNITDLRTVHSPGEGMDLNKRTVQISSVLAEMKNCNSKNCTCDAENALKETLSLCDLRSVVVNGSKSEQPSPVLRFIGLFFSNFDIELLRGNDAMKSLMANVRASKVYLERNDDDNKQYQRALVDMQMKMFMIQQHARKWKDNPTYVNLIDTFLEYVHTVHYRSRGLKDHALRGLIDKVVPDVEKAVVLVLVQGAGCLEGACPLWSFSSRLETQVKNWSGVPGTVALVKLAKFFGLPDLIAWGLTLINAPGRLCQRMLNVIGYPGALPDIIIGRTECAEDQVNEDIDRADTLIKNVTKSGPAEP